MNAGRVPARRAGTVCRLSAGATDIAGRLIISPLRRLLAWAPDADGRVVLLAAVAVYFAAIASGRLVWGVDLWPRLGVPSGPSLFFDARNVTAAWECARLGYDPLYQNPCDPWGRPLNYLRPWLLLGALGLDQSHTFGFAAVLIAAMFVSFSLLLGRVPAGTGIVMALAACSPAVMLAVERANMDIAMFPLVASSLLWWQTFPGTGRVVSPVLMLVAAVAKIYPGFALPVFVVTRSRIALRASLLCLAGFTAYLAYSLSDIVHIARIAPQGDHFSYGARILLANLYHLVGADHWAGPAALKQLLAALPLAVGVAAIGVRVRRGLAPPLDDVIVTPAPLMALLAGSLVYLGTFAVGKNFDYRLVFLLLTLPQLCLWARMSAHRLSSLASITVVAILVLLWVGSLSQLLGLWDELASWIVAGLLTAIAAATIPRLATVSERLFGRRVVTGHHGTKPAR
jgi:hypothetical protein